MSDTVIKVENLSKLYRLGELHKQTDSFRDKMAQTFSRLVYRSRRSAVGGQPSNSHIWALKDISFEVEEGEVLGIIGRNGAGKSTLLKILSRITKPTDGRALITGRVSSLLEVGTGFHPELTGRENIYLNGAILGMRKAEIKRKFDDIVDFAEIEKFIDTPVKRYSSGMYVRLAFAVAAHLEPEILLVDEVLAVGDTAFQRKCLGKMHQVGVQGRTVLFVSHNMAAVRNLCNRGVVLDGGHAVFEGDVDSAVERYLRSMDSLHGVSLIHRNDRKGNGLLRVQALRIQDAQGRKVETLRAGETGMLCLDYLSEEGIPLRNVLVSIAFDTLEGSRVCMLQSDYVDADFSTVPPRGTFMCRIPRLALNSGLYVITIFVTVNGVISDWVSRAGRIQIVTGDFFGTSKVPDPHDGYLLLDHSWEVVEQAQRQNLMSTVSEESL